MKKIDISRALRDSEYRNSLSAAERAMLPAHPAGPSSISDDVLRSMAGGCGYTQCNNCTILPQTNSNIIQPLSACEICP